MEWRAGLVRGDRGQVLACEANATVQLDHDPVLAGLVALDAFRGEFVVTRAPPPSPGQPPLPGPYPRPWTDADVALILSYFQRVETKSYTVSMIRAALIASASAHRIHPVLSWLDGLRHDGAPRLDRWLQAAFGAPDTPYVRAVGRAMLVAAVRRVRSPGCKHDAIPVLDGAQGIGKSRSIRVLFGDAWFTDALPGDLGDKDAALALAGKWCIELAELDQLIRTETETVKSFLSRQVDRYRPPYQATVVERPRQCVLVGTSNRTDYLRDQTGNRRFWPVRCAAADPDWVAVHREQLWAEAAAAEAAGDPHWLPDDVLTEATATQADYVPDDPWDETVRTWIDREAPTTITTAQVLTEAIGMPRERHDRRASLRVADLLRRAGWESVSVRDGRTVVRRWRRAANQHTDDWLSS